MQNIQLVSEILKEQGRYPAVENDETGLLFQMKNNELIISGSSMDLIELADLLVSLALSGENKGQHWHIDNMTLLDENSEISELILKKKTNSVR